MNNIRFPKGVDCMDLSYLLLFNKSYRECLVSSTISSCLAINDSLDMINAQYDFLYFKMPKLSILDKITGKIFILQRKYKIKNFLSEKYEYITRRYVILITTRLNFNCKMFDYSKSDVEKNTHLDIKMSEYKRVYFLIKKTKHLFKAYYLKYVYFWLRLDILSNKKLIKIRGDTKSINNYSFVT